MVTEAGGRFTGWDAGENGLVTGNPLATNGVIHEALMQIAQGGAVT